MEKKYTREVTERFLKATEAIMASRNMKLNEFAEKIGIRASNFIRLKQPDSNVTVESLCQVVHLYHVSPIWLITGTGDVFANMESANATSVIISRMPVIEVLLDEIKKSIKALKTALPKKQPATNNVGTTSKH